MRTDDGRRQPRVGFSSMVIERARRHLPAQHRAVPAEPLASLDYAVELEVKDAALRLFWESERLPGRPELVVASPRPRGYRTTSKRRVISSGSHLALILGDRTAGPPPRGVQASSLEPVEHAASYDLVFRKLAEPAFRPLASHLNYVIVRGSYVERAVIFNVDRFDAAVVRKVKLLAEHLRGVAQPPIAVFLFLDPSRSEYYLESRRPAAVLSYKKIYGPDNLVVTFGANRYCFSPLSFSQVNESAVPPMLKLAGQMLPRGTLLVDLYCGYGLFSHFLAPNYREVLGVDAEGPSIEAAAANTRLNPEGGRRRFLARRITKSVIDGILRQAPRAVLLDPPRQGPLPGVIAALAAHRPDAVLHVFCGVDQIPSSLREWQAGGYRVERVTAVDLFPGTPNLEVLVQLGGT